MFSKKIDVMECVYPSLIDFNEFVKNETVKKYTDEKELNKLITDTNNMILQEKMKNMKKSKIKKLKRSGHLPPGN